jgi:hypothetical protein
MAKAAMMQVPIAMTAPLRRSGKTPSVMLRRPANILSLIKPKTIAYDHRLRPSPESVVSPPFLVVRITRNRYSGAGLRKK